MSDAIQFLKPSGGSRVRKPDGMLMDDAGESINTATDATYWFRRLTDGDVVIATPAENNLAKGGKS